MVFLMSMAGVSAAEDVNKTDDLGLSLDSNLDDSPEIFNAIDNGMNLKENSNSNENLKSDSNILSVSNDDVLAGNNITPADFTFASIQTAVESASDGDTIILKAGTYLNNGSGEITINKKISIVGVKDSTILDAQKKSGIFNIAKNVNITGIVFMNGSGENGAISFEGNGNVISCTFKDNFGSSRGGAIYFKGGGENSVINCAFTNNNGDMGGAIYFLGIRGDVINCTFKDNSARYEGGAVHWRDGYCNMMINCTFINNTVREEDGGGAVYFEYIDDDANVINCTFINNTVKQEGGGGAIYLIYGSVTVNNCALVNNTAPGNSEIYIEDGGFDLNNNWWGSNNPDWNKLIGGYVPEVYAVLNLTANPCEISYDEMSNITTKFVWNGTNTDATKLLPKRNVKLSSNGNLTKTEVDVGLTSEFSAFTKDIYYVNATADNEMLEVNVKVNSTKPITTNITVKHTSLDLTVGETGFIIAELNPPEAGSLKCDYDDKIIDIKTNPDGSLTVTALAEGNANITFSFPGNKHYAPAENKTVTVTVSLNDASVSGEDMALNVGETGAIKYTTDPEALKVLFTEDNSGIVSVDEQGIVTALKQGKANITITVGDNKKYALNSTTITVSVSLNDASVSGEDMALNVGETRAIKYSTNPEALKVAFIVDDSGIVSVDEQGIVTALKQGKANITITVGDNKKYTLNSTTITVSVSLNDASVNGKDMALNVGETGAIKYSTNPKGLNVSFTEDNSGIVSVDEQGIVTALKQGKANITITVGDNKKYALNSTIICVNVHGLPSKIIIENDTLDMIIGDVVDPGVTLMPSDAGNLSFTVSDENIVLVNGYGVVTAVGVGNATIFVRFDGNDKYLPSNATITVSVKNALIIKAPDVVKYYGGPERFVVNVTDSKGTPLSNKSVTIVINKVTYNRTTDENGIASMAIVLPSGTFNATVTVDNNTVNSVVNVLTTVNGTDVVKVFRNATQYYATFRDSEGNYLKDGTVVKFNINGVMYERKISGNEGLARLNLNLEQGRYVITAMNPETGENAANNITIISRLIENRDITKYYRNETQYTVKIIGDEGNPVGAGESVTFNINGVFYTRQTNESGIAKLNLNLQPGDYIITGEYKNCKVSNNIKILPVLFAEDITMKYRDGTKFVAKLVDGQGNPLAGETIQFNINGVFYNRVTDSSGQAKLNINLMAGEYIITSSYNGANIANTVTISA